MLATETMPGNAHLGVVRQFQLPEERGVSGFSGPKKAGAAMSSAGLELNTITS